MSRPILVGKCAINTGLPVCNPSHRRKLKKSVVMKTRALRPHNSRLISDYRFDHSQTHIPCHHFTRRNTGRSSSSEAFT
jgi:hypothetical protein